MSEDVRRQVKRGEATARRLLEKDAGSRRLDRVDRGILIAEGDSWFDYPRADVLDVLEELGWEIESVSHHGDNIENIAYDEAQLMALVRAFRRVHERGEVPKGLLLSGGGNDFAGPELSMLLEHSGSGRGEINSVITGELFEGRMRAAWASLLGFTKQLSVSLFGQPLKTVVHGYDYPVPDGRGFIGGWGGLPGPWLAPSYALKALGSETSAGLELRTALTRRLIDDYNSMLQTLSSEPGLGHVKYVDLRGTLVAEDYRELWANELHPTQLGFRMVAAKLDEALEP